MTNKIAVTGSPHEVDYCQRAITAFVAVQQRDAETLNAVVFATLLKQKGFLSKHKYILEPVDKTLALKPFVIRLLDNKTALAVERVLNMIKAANGYKRLIECVNHAYRYYIRFGGREMSYKEAIAILNNAEKYVNTDELLDDILAIQPEIKEKKK